MSAAHEGALAERVVAACYGARCRMERLTHVNNAVFRLHLDDGTRILKLARNPDGDGVRKELMLIERLARADVPAPQVEHADPEGQRVGRPFFVMRSAGERTVFDWASASGQPAEGLYHDMGAVLARIHGITFERSGDIRHDGVVDRDLDGFLAGLHRWADTLAGTGVITAAEAQGLRARALPPVDGRSLCHSDFHAVHCVVADGRISAVVDWESAWAGNPLVDLAIASTYLEFYSQPALLARFSSGYAQVRPLPEDFELAYLPVRMVHLIAFLRVWHGQGPRAWRHVLQQGKVAGVVALFRRYAARAGG